MDLVMLVLGLLVGALVGALLVRSSTRADVAVARAERDGLRERVVDLEATLGEDAQTAAALVPMQQALRRVEVQVETLERDRVDQYASVRDALGRVEQTSALVGREAGSLAGALRVSSVRGRWGEVQLRRVLELAGLLDRCDFVEQATGVSTDGREVRPDVVVQLPGGKHLVVDAKAPMSRWLDAQAEDLPPDEVTRLLRAHAQDLARHVTALADKRYWSAFEPTPEMVVCFVPSDATLATALAHDPGLHERALEQRVVLTSPATLLALLRTVAYTWRQDALTTSAQELLVLGRELHDRLGTLGGHTHKLGAQLRRSVESYNAMVGALESRVLVSARRISELGLAEQPVEQLVPLETAPRPLTAPELLDAVAAQERRDELDLDTARRPREGSREAG